MSWRALRLVWGRLRSDWQFLLACWLLVATATALVSAGALYADTVELGGVRRALAEADPANQGVLVRLPASAADADSLDAAVRPVLANSFDQAGADVVTTVRSASLLPAAGGQPGLLTGVPVGQQLVVLGAYEAIDQHATLIEGRWPTAGQAPMEAAISEQAAAALGLQLGARLQLADAATPNADQSVITADVQIVGIWSVNQRSDPYWLGDQLDLDGQTSGTTSTRGPVMVARADLLATATAAGVDLRWRALPHVERLSVGRIDVLRADLAGIPAALAAALPAGQPPTVNTGLADVLGTIDRSVAVSRGGVVLVILQFVLLAGYAVLLAGALLVERRRAEVAILRARGARVSQVGLLALGESLAIAVPATVLAPLVALGLIGIIGSQGAVGDAGIIAAPSLSLTVLLVTALAGLACVLVLSLPALVSDVDLAHVRAAIGRPFGRTLAQRLGLDLVLLVVTGIGLYQLQSYGSPLTQDASGNLTVDPVLVAAPAASLAAGALLVIRLVPRLGEIADRLFGRQRGLTLPLAASQVARRPLRYTRTALLIVLAAALGTFAATYTSTWSDSQAAQAAYQVGPDLRVPVNAQSALVKAGAAATLAGIAGVRSATPVVRDRLDVGHQLRNADVLMVDAAQVAAQLAFPPEATARDGAGQLAAIGSTDTDFPGVDLPASAQRLGIVLDVALDSIDPRFPVHGLVPMPGQGVQIEVQVLVDDQIVRITAIANTFAASGFRLAIPLPARRLNADTAGPPPRLLAVSLRGLAPVTMGGSITIVRIESSPSGSGDSDWTTVALAADLAGWQFPAGGVSLHFDTNNPMVRTVEFDFERPQIFRFGPLQTAGHELRVLASDSLLAASGSAVGDDLSLTYHTATFAAVIAGSVPNFPSLDPGRPFLIVDRPGMRIAASDQNIADPTPNEWWLWVDQGAEEAVATALEQPPLAATGIISQARLRQSLERDPVALGLIGALVLGSLAAAACAAIGLIVGAIVSTRERATETALLRALGMSGGGVTAGVAIDNGYLLLFGLPAGIGLGMLIGLLVLPHTPLNRTGAPVVPAAQVVVPVDALLALAAVGLLLLVVTVAAAARAANRPAIADVLRAGEN
jgi:hypothetical protein